MKPFFPSESSSVRVTTGTGTMPGSVRLRGQGGQFFDAYASIAVTSLQVTDSVNHQFTQSLEDTTYLYTFGNNIKEIQVAGMALPPSCNTSATSGTQEVGIDQILSLYDSLKASNTRSGTSPRMEVTVGSRVFVTYWVNLNYSYQDPVTRIINFSMAMRGVQL